RVARAMSVTAWRLRSLCLYDDTQTVAVNYFLHEPAPLGAARFLATDHHSRTQRNDENEEFSRFDFDNFFNDVPFAGKEVLREFSRLVNPALQSHGKSLDHRGETVRRQRHRQGAGRFQEA